MYLIAYFKILNYQNNIKIYYLTIDNIIITTNLFKDKKICQL